MKTMSSKLTFCLWMAFLVVTIRSMASLGDSDTVRAVLNSPGGLADMAQALSSIEILSEFARLATVALASWLLVATSTCFLLEHLSIGSSRRRSTPKELPTTAYGPDKGRPGRPALLLLALRRTCPRFVVAIAASSVVSAGVASASPVSSDPHGSSDRRSSEPPMMELMTPAPGVQTYMPWGPTAASTPAATAPAVPGSTSSPSDSSGDNSDGPAKSPTTAQPSANNPGPNSELVAPVAAEPSPPTMEALSPTESAPKHRRTKTYRTDTDPTDKAIDDGPAELERSIQHTRIPATSSPWLSSSRWPAGTSDPSTPTTESRQSGTPGAAHTPAETAPRGPARATTHVVATGEHLWSIAESTLRQRLGSDVDTKQIASYWRELIKENHHRLADPGNPDLILPGQELTLPA